ncbi:arginyl-tRNA synthetase [Thermaerobacter marianensis DSM 12885]|uniref:Arginine--tRNA ligase n=1 Tax=Thermaerobacter marianensis (strain ATCC 700841 / DSM 12885 / JCM 10246 / 7p75a) TaxID=644966 RepID=E6SLH4_THEM7|nr:arginine--tRNA ligase [Thermaerobacter marianensis]ADU52416.1 arginyl-tRNA synthetase [Thermaerobacter marianensis DSM 12885]
MAVDPVASAKQQVRDALAAAARAAVAAGELPAEADPANESWRGVQVEVPRDPRHGDFASNAALVLAGRAGRPPREVAAVFQRHLPGGAWLRQVEVAGPGFLNFYLADAWWKEGVRAILQAGDAFGATDAGAGRKVQVEFVSANPTGPLGVVNARAAALGDALARVLEAAGYRVEKEFYLNDAGNQIRKLAQSVEARMRQELGQEAEIPEGGYPGAYLIDIARDLLAAEGPGLLDRPEEQRWERMARFAVESLVAQMRTQLARFGVEFDVWYPESRVRAEGYPERVLERLRQRDMVYEHDGAVWLRSSAVGDDKDRVLVRRDGEYTYTLVDIAYHLTKWERGFQQAIDIWGQDHHGHVVPMEAALRALGLPDGWFEVLLTQMVHLVRGGQAVRMSKRRGELVTMAEFLDEVDVDAARYFFLMRSPDTHLDFDLDLANLRSNENPVYYVQYAHARACGILRQAEAEAGLRPDPAADLSPLGDPAERDLARRLLDLPGEVAAAAAAREPHRLTYYLKDVATLFHQFYTRCRVLGEEEPVARARLALVDATRRVLARTLGLLGVTAPERM